VLYGEIEYKANKQLPNNISIEISKNWIHINDYSKGWDKIICLSSYKIKGKSIKDVVKKVEEILNNKLYE